MPVPLRKMASAASAPTKKTAKDITQLLKYVHMHPDATVTFHSSNTIIHTHSDSSYVPNNKKYSRTGGINFSAAEIPQEMTVQVAQFRLLAKS